MNSSFFDTTSYFIDEKVRFIRFDNAYTIYDQQGNTIGFVKQKLSGWDKLLRLLLSKSLLPFTLEIRDAEGLLRTSLHRGWTFILSKIEIKDANGKSIGSIRQKFKLLKPSFRLFDNDNRLIAIISGDWKAWNFNIAGTDGATIGVINKKWAGALKEIFTSADKYNVQIHEQFSDPVAKLIVVSSAITIDMVLKESK